MTEGGSELLKKAEQFARAGMFAKAKAEVERFLLACPDSLEAHRILAGIYYRQGETEKAIQVYRTILYLSPEDEEAADMLGSLRSTEALFSRETGEERTSGEDEEPGETGQVPFYEIRDDIDYSDLEVDFFEKPVPVREGPVSRELEEFRRIREESRDAGARPEPAEAMADVLIKQGQYEKAMDIFNDILLSDPENQRVKRKREELLEVLKDHGKRE